MKSADYAERRLQRNAITVAQFTHSHEWLARRSITPRADTLTQFLKYLATLIHYRYVILFVVLIVSIMCT